MSVVAKFRVTEIGPANGDGSNHLIRLNPVIDGSEENREFYSYTPGGEIVLSTVNAAAAAYFVLEGEYYINFTKADA